MKSGGNKDKHKNLLQSDVIVEPFDNLIGKFKSGEYIVSVYGLGHVGAPIASAWLRSGVTVIGIDKSAKCFRKCSKRTNSYSGTYG